LQREFDAPNHERAFEGPSEIVVIEVIRRKGQNLINKILKTGY
jgi:hypothetical protein